MAQRLRQREAEFEQRLDGKAVRTEALGRDRHHRSYWSLQGCHAALWVETPDGERLGVLTSAQDLQRLGDSLLETGAREHALSQVRPSLLGLPVNNAICRCCGGQEA